MRHIYVLALIFSLAACHTPAVQRAGTDIVDCTTGQLSKVGEIAELAVPALNSGELDWRSVEDAAIRAGVDVGGCAIAHLATLLSQIRGFAGPNRGEVALARLRTVLGAHPTYITAEGKI